jgi:antitoxin StbD
MVPARLFEAMIEEMGDRDLVALARARLARKDTAVEVNIDEI